MTALSSLWSASAYLVVCSACTGRSLPAVNTTLPSDAVLCCAVLCCAVSCCAMICRYIALQRDPRFKGIYESYLSMFEGIGLVSEAAPWMQFTSAGLPSK
jgi:hypothetical protein